MSQFIVAAVDTTQIPEFSDESEFMITLDHDRLYFVSTRDDATTARDLFENQYVTLADALRALADVIDKL